MWNPKFWPKRRNKIVKEIENEGDNEKNKKGKEGINESIRRRRRDKDDQTNEDNEEAKNEIQGRSERNEWKERSKDDWRNNSYKKEKKEREKKKDERRRCDLLSNLTFVFLHASSRLVLLSYIAVSFSFS